jgi:hypothetical protein
MKTKNTFGVHFTIRLNRMKDGKCPVYLRIVVNGTRSELSLKSMVAVYSGDVDPPVPGKLTPLFE